VDKFLEYIEKYKFAILGTVIFHFFFFMSSNFVTIERPFPIAEEIVEADIEEEIELDEEMMEMLEILRNQENPDNQELYNLAADQNDKRQKSFENFSTQEIDEQVMSDAKELEKQYFEEWASTHPNEAAAVRSKVKTEVDDKKSKTDGQVKSKVDNTGENAFAGTVMVSFNLPKRKAYELSNPGYTCNGSGTVVIDIKVDKSGEVKEVSYNPSLSSGASDCMIEKAKVYAKRSRFNLSAEVSGTQSGTITYKFQGQ
jgi:hypothetical protein